MLAARSSFWWEDVDARHLEGRLVGGAEAGTTHTLHCQGRHVLLGEGVEVKIGLYWEATKSKGGGSGKQEGAEGDAG